MQKSRKKKEKKKQKNRTLMAIMLIILYLGGLFVYAIPDLQKVALQKENEKAVEHFKEEVEGSQLDKSGEEKDSTLPIPIRSQRTPSSTRRCRHIISRSFLMASQD